MRRRRALKGSTRSDVAKAILRALDESSEDEWTARHLGYSKSLSNRLNRAYKTAHPDRRNSPQYRFIELALAALVEAGEVETKTGTAVSTMNETYYRHTTKGREAAAEL